MSIEKASDPTKIRHWMGHMETDYKYTLGLANERFFKEIKENGRIMGGKCDKCNMIYVPPRNYCERCFERIREWVDVGKSGEVCTYTLAYINIEGERLENPDIYAFIKIGKADGGIVHRLGEIAHDNVAIGTPVEAVFKPLEERTGSITDIKYFKPRSKTTK